MSSQNRGYGPYLASGLLHAALLVLVTWGASHSESPKRVYRPQYIEAKLLDLKPKTKQQVAAQKAPEKKPDKPVQPPPNKVIVKKQPDAPDVAKQQKVAEQKQQEAEQAAKKIAEQKAKEVAEQKAKQQALEKAKQEQAKRQAAEKAKQEAAAQAKKAADEKAKKAAEAKAKAAQQEKERLAKEAARKREQELQRQREVNMAQALAAEESLLMAEQSDVVAQSYIAAIADRIERNWSRPPSARNGMLCVLRIMLVPTGQVVDVSVVKSSGNSSFDRSAVQAVQKVERFDELKNMPTDVFEANFRELILNFSPEDLRL